MASVRTVKSSILKNYAASGRNQIKTISNRVRFELLAERNLHQLLVRLNASEPGSQNDYHQYLQMVRDENISDADFLSAIKESKQCIELLTKHEELAKALVALDWMSQRDETIVEYQSFLIDLLSSHNKFVKDAAHNLIAKLVPKELECGLWSKGEPADDLCRRMNYVLRTAGTILDVIPLSLETVTKACNTYFPFYTKPSFVYAGFVRNLLKLMAMRPIIKEELFMIILNKYGLPLRCRLCIVLICLICS